MSLTVNTPTDEQYMAQALALAKQAIEHDEVPVGCLVVKDEQVIGQGYNKSILECDPSAHAEIVALRQAAKTEGSYRLDGATLYVTVEPCLMCCGALLQARISRLVYGVREPRTGAVVSQFDSLMSQNNRPIAISEGVLADEAKALMQAFFEARR
ncbi:MAG: tRNA adenosine(34) deaminase TadA [Gammaproteobacteria bacterium]|nr:tRNA adenosine(34) deaminase TadA [Gammaproteobacteria bacterium]